MSIPMYEMAFWVRVRVRVRVRGRVTVRVTVRVRVRVRVRISSPLEGHLVLEALG